MKFVGRLKPIGKNGTHWFVLTDEKPIVFSINPKDKFIIKTVKDSYLRRYKVKAWIQKDGTLLGFTPNVEA